MAVFYLYCDHGSRSSEEGAEPVEPAEPSALGDLVNRDEMLSFAQWMEFCRCVSKSSRLTEVRGPQLGWAVK